MIEEKNRQSRSYQAPQLPSQLIWGSVRFIFFSIIILFLIIAGLFVYYRWEIAASGSRIVIDAGSPELGAAERLVLQGFLSFNANRLAEPVGTLEKTTFFTIVPGSNANQIAIDLVQLGVIAPQRENLFLNYLRFYGLDAMLEAGTYEIPPTATIPELSGILTDSVGGKVELRFLEGWRSEEIANYLRVTRPAKIDSAEFLAIVNRRQSFDLSPYPFLAQLKPTDSLEGFLLPDKYRVSVETTAAELIQQMLKKFDLSVTPQMRQAYGVAGLSIRDAVNLAAIVQREAVIEDERPIIASVFFNRLRSGTKLDADPTVQYAVGYQAESDNWWKVPLSTADLQINSPYNTYQNVGLPPAPIANPSMGALQAVANPAQTEYIYFVAGCNPQNPNTHLFSVTYEEHLANVENCR